MSSSIRPNEDSEDELYRLIFRLQKENEELRQKVRDLETGRAEDNPIAERFKHEKDFGFY